MQKFKKEFPKIPIISEENTTRNSKEPIFLVDPLDGTKEFIKRNDEFTVNIALIINRKSTLGIIDLPSKNIQYFSDGKNSFKFYNGILKKISSSKKREKINIVVSRSHPDESSKNFLNSIKVKSNIIEVGSSIKFCLLAEGKVDLYYRYGNTMEWDTAAGSAIIQTAKANIINFKFKDFDYGKKNFRNSSFIVFNKNINKNLLKLIIKKKKP